MPQEEPAERAVLNRPNAIEYAAKLAANLRFLVGQLEDHDHVDEDQSWLKEGKGPPRRLKRGPQYAITNVRETAHLIFEAEKLCDKLPCNDLNQRTRVALTLAHEAIGQADVPAELAMLEGNWAAAIECAREGLRRAWKCCGDSFRLLVAEWLTAVRRLATAPAGRIGADTPARAQPTDLITTAVAIRDFVVSRTTLRRLVAAGQFHDYRESRHSANATLKLSREEVAARYPSRKK
jgi:hypothetical protein